MESNDKTYEVAIDIGGTRTKFGYRQIGKKDLQIFNESTQELFIDPDLAVTTILSLLKKHNITKISLLCISLAGIVNHQTHTLIKSKLLERSCSNSGKTFQGFNWHANFATILGHKNIVAMNDGVGSALGIINAIDDDFINTFPVMSITLGTNAAISTITYQKEKFVIYACETWPDFMGGHFGYCTFENEGRIEFSKRLKLALINLSKKCYDTLGFKPKTFYITGGISVDIDKDLLKDSEIPIRYFGNDEDQIKALLLGCFKYSDIYNQIEIIQQQSLTVELCLVF